MSARTYKPQPGTLPAKVLGHLKALPAGARLSTDELAHRVDTDKSSLVQAMKTARAAGAVQAVRDAGLLWWSIGTGKPDLPGVPAEELSDHGIQAAAAKPAAPIEKKQHFCAGLFTDGTLQVELDERSFTLGPQQVQQLRSLLKSWSTYEQSVANG